MPTPLTVLADAEDRLEVLIQSAADPTVSAGEIADLLEDAQRASLWIAATAYTVGTVIVPTVANANGHRFVCVTAGTSGATEPTWTTGRQSQVTDGTTLVWQETGTDYGHVLWDLQAAASAGWMLKAGKAAPQFDFSDENQNFKKSQIHAHCLKMAAYYAPAVVG